MIKSIKFDEYHNIIEIEFEGGLPVKHVLEAMYELGIRRRPADNFDASMKTENGRVWRSTDDVSKLMADSLHDTD